MSRGFTLIEIMIVVAIVAILSAIALPSYSDYVLRSKLPEAFSALSDQRIRLEQYYQGQQSLCRCGRGDRMRYRHARWQVLHLYLRRNR